MKKCESISNRNTSVVARPDCVACDLGGEMVILNMESGVYFGLNGVGAEIWNELQSQRTVAEITEALLTRYDVDPDRCEREVVTLLERMAAQNLIVLEGYGETE